MTDRRSPKVPRPTPPPKEPSPGDLSDTINGTLRMEADDIKRYIKRQSYRGSLLVIAGLSADIGAHLVVDGAVRIGREAHDLPLHDGGISRQHALVSRREEGYFIQDLGSTNGTLVNGEQLRGERMLIEGDKIFLSQTVIKFTLVDETEAAYLKQVEHLVGTDELTGLMSKHRFDASFKEAVRGAARSGSPLVVMMMDMDGLKAVNDRHGHKYGAATIAQVGKLIGRVLAGRGKACRFGGDEFTAFMPGADRETGCQVAEQIRAEVEALRPFPELPDLSVTISIGLAELPHGGTDPAVLLERADQALYRAKAGGKNLVSE